MQPLPLLRDSTLHWLCYVLVFMLSMVIRSISYSDLPTLQSDETTYLTVGQDLARGYLPYSRYWTTKPPLAFVFYALVVKCFGNSILATRVVGAVYIAVCACITYNAGRMLNSRLVGVLAGLGMVVLATCVPYGYMILTEHLILLPAAWLCYQICSGRKLGWQLGFAIALCTLIRPNLLVLLPAGILVHYLCSDTKRLWPSILSVSAWFMAPILFIIAIYVAAGYGRELYIVVIRFSLMIAVFNLTEIEHGDGYQSFLWARNAGMLLVTVLSMPLFINFGLKKGVDRRRQSLVIFTAAAFVSVLLSGDARPRYSIQLFPFFGLVLADQVVVLAGKGKKHMVACIVSVLALGAVWGAIALPRIYGYEHYLDEKESRDNGKALLKIADYLKKHHAEDGYLLCPQTPLFNFLTGALLPVSNVSSNDFRWAARLQLLYGPDYTLSDLAKDAFDKAPLYVVILAAGREHFFPQEWPYINRFYELEKTGDHYRIFKRKQ